MEVRNGAPCLPPSLLGALAALTLAISACEPPPPAVHTFAIRVTARDPLEQPIQGARLWLAGRAAGQTDEAGQLQARFRGPHGSVVDLLLSCPAGHRADEPERRLPMRVASASGKEPVPLRVALTCTAEQPLSALVIRANPGLPVLIDGKRMGQTGPDGTEHLLLRAIPGTTLQVTLDTTDAPDLLPQHPVTSFEVDPQDQLLLVDQVFDHKPRKRRRPQHPRAAPAAPPPTIPKRIR